MKKAILGILAASVVVFTAVPASAQGSEEPDVFSYESLRRCPLSEDEMTFIRQNTRKVKMLERFALVSSNSESWRESDGKGGNIGKKAAEARQNMTLKAYCSLLTGLIPKIQQRLMQN